MIYQTNVQNINFKYFVFFIHKNDKCVDLSIYIFKSSNLTEFSHFCAAHNKENSTLKI
jgi:hypothetical protein